MRTKPLLPIGWKFVSILTIFGGGQSQHPLCGLTNNYLPRREGGAYSHVISSCLVKKSFIISKMEEVDVDLCQRKSRSPLQWPGVDENDHSGQKHEEDFSREESNVFYDILERKNAFLGYKNKKFKKSKNWHFSMVLVQKWPFFQLFLLR